MFWIQYSRLLICNSFVGKHLVLDTNLYILSPSSFAFNRPIKLWYKRCSWLCTYIYSLDHYFINVNNFYSVTRTAKFQATIFILYKVWQWNLFVYNMLRRMSSATKTDKSRCTKFLQMDENQAVVSS